MENAVSQTEDIDLALAVSIQRSQGLMHLLAVAYNAKDDRNGPPTQDEADGIRSLVSGVSLEIDEAFKRVEGLISQSGKAARKGARA